jgi:hypothetical protein
MTNYKNGYANGISCQTALSRPFLLDLEERSIRLKAFAREYILTLKGNYLFGERFNDPSNIVARSASHCLQSHDSDTRDNFVIAAFIDAADADWYYTHEKEY